MAAANSRRNTRQNNQDIRQDNQDVALAVINTNIDYIKQEITSLNLQLNKNYMTRQEGEILRARLKLLERAVYGVFTTVGVIVIAYILRGLAVK